jgi:hypothetical protein
MAVFVAKPKYFANLGFASISPDSRKMPPSICANGEIQSISNSTSTVPGQFLKVWIESVVHTGLKEGGLTLDEKMTLNDFFRPNRLVREIFGVGHLSKTLEFSQFRG